MSERRGRINQSVPRRARPATGIPGVAAPRGRYLFHPCPARGRSRPIATGGGRSTSRRRSGRTVLRPWTRRRARGTESRAPVRSRGPLEKVGESPRTYPYYPPIGPRVTGSPKLHVPGPAPRTALGEEGGGRRRMTLATGNPSRERERAEGPKQRPRPNTGTPGHRHLAGAARTWPPVRHQAATGGRDSGVVVGRLRRPAGTVRRSGAQA